ncbi:MAG: universal stress protein [Xanthomonadales bacterium]|jgi:nucleotide-binding universal stress UspA family protein|nr:universal stress protein [Xanthomonadales bacterium]
MQRFKNILCVVNEVKSSKEALKRAARLALNNQARLTVTGVAPHVSVGMGIPENGQISKELQAAVVKTCATELAAAVSTLDNHRQIETRVLVGIGFLEIIREILRHDFDLVIKATENTEWLQRMFGSEDMHLLRKCPCPVWLVKPSSPSGFRRVIAAVDVDNAYPPGELQVRRALNHLVLELASSQALADSAELHIVHAWQAVGESAMRGSFMRSSEEKVSAYIDSTRQLREAEMDRLIAHLAERIGEQGMQFLAPLTHLEKGRVRKVIPSLASRLEADLVVMGTVARTGVPGFITGNSAESILQQIDCSVLAVKPPGFETPVTLE